MKKYFIALQIIGLKNKEIIYIMETFTEEDIKNIFKGNFLELEFKYNISFKSYERSILKENPLDIAEEILEKNKIKKIKTILYINKIYPKRLKDIENPPAILYVIGQNITQKDQKALACVGTRNISKQAKKAEENLITNLTREGFVIISGLADGADLIAHKACIDNGGRTIAVVAHGLDMIYPKQNEELADMILKSEGTIISEYPIGTKPEKFRFVRRNRIVSALSNGIVMIEAKEISGTRHTIDFAIKQNKQIFCPIYSENTIEASLNDRLIKENLAIQIKSINDYIKIPIILGYKAKNKEIEQKFKNEQIQKILGNNIMQVSFKEFDLSKSNRKIGTTVNEELYLEFKMILKKNKVTMKDFFNLVMIDAINKNRRDR